jgi:hypothetical protein
VYALTSFPFYVLPYSSAKNSPLGPSHDLGLGVAFMPFLVRCPIGIDCILDLMFPAHLSLGHNYAEFPYFYLKPPAGHCADLAT